MPSVSNLIRGGSITNQTLSVTCPAVVKLLGNSIAFGSAPRREADSQPISQLVRQAVSQTVSRASRQADRNTVWGFSVADLASSSGENRYCQNENGRTAMHPTAGVPVVGSSNPGRPTTGGAGRPVICAQSDPRSNPAEHKLLSTNF